MGRIGHLLPFLVHFFYPPFYLSCFDISGFVHLPPFPSSTIHLLPCMYLISIYFTLASISYLKLSWIPTYLFFSFGLTVPVPFFSFFPSSFPFLFPDPHRTIPLPYILLSWIGFIYFFSGTLRSSDVASRVARGPMEPYSDSLAILYL